MPREAVINESPKRPARLLGRIIAVGLLTAVPIAALGFLGVSFSLAMLADAPGAGGWMPEPAGQVRSAPAASPAAGQDEGTKVLDNWTYTRKPFSPST